MPTPLRPRPESKEPERGRRRVELAFCLALLGEVLLFHRKVLFYKGYLFPWDFRSVHWPLAAFAADSFHHGQWPLWDPYTYCGSPFFANIQSALFYPPMLVASLAGSWLGVDALPRLLAISAVIQIAFAGVSTYILLRRLGASPGSAWIGGTMYALGSFFASQTEHLGAIQGAAWLPIAWLCVWEVRFQLRCRWIAGLSAALAMSILAGLPQVAVAAFGSALMLAASLAAFGLARRAVLLRVLLAWCGAVALAAVQLIPTIELTRHSIAKYRAEWLKSGGGVKLEALYSLVAPNHSHVFDLSRFHGPGELTFLYLYSSLLGLALAVAAIIWKPDRITRAVATLVAAATLCMLGDSTPLGRAIFLALPVSVRIGIHPEYWLCVFSLALAVLAGLGADKLLPSLRLAMVAGALIAFDLLWVSSGRPFNLSSFATDPGISRNAIEGSTELMARLRILTSVANPPYRFDMAEGVPFYWSESAPLLAMPTPNGCDPMAPERAIQLRLSFSPGERWGACYQVANPSSPVLALTNTRYLLAGKPLESRALQLVSQVRGYRVYDLPNTLPRFFLVHHVVSVNGVAEAARKIHASDFLPAKAAIVEGAVEEIDDGTGAGESVDTISYQPAAMEIRTHAASAALLVVTDSYYPGWEASVDGRPAKLYAADVAFRGVRVPAGDHQVQLRFVPRILYRSALITAAAALFVLIAIRRFR